MGQGIPANKILCLNVGIMLGQRNRRWTSINLTFVNQCSCLAQCCFHDGPPSSSSAQHENSIGSTSRVCWEEQTNPRVIPLSLFLSILTTAQIQNAVSAYLRTSQLPYFWLCAEDLLWWCIFWAMADYPVSRLQPHPPPAQEMLISRLLTVSGITLTPPLYVILTNVCSRRISQKSHIDSCTRNHLSPW